MKKLCLISLGCDKNLVDSELMLGKLINENADENYELTDDETEAEVIIVNTCAFILDAQEESVNTLLKVAEYKKTGKLENLIVMGCLGERFKGEIQKEIPEVDKIIAVSEFEDMIDKLPKKKRISSFGLPYGYLKIAEGCNKRCTYCIIPYLRGSYKSYPIEDILYQAEELVHKGVRELIVVAQETTIYGTDIYGTNKLPELLNRLSEIEGIEWIRLLYAYPEEITDELIYTMRDNVKICHYLDIPIQHASDNILKRMGRRMTYESVSHLLNKLRAEIPDIVIRTTLISGFPGETEEDHKILVDFIKQNRFEHLGDFTYSQEEGTPAAVMEDQIDDAVKTARRDEIMTAQQLISVENLNSKIGMTFKAMIDGYLPEENVYVARTYMDAPDIDGYVYVESEKRHMSGDMINVIITGSSEYDLIGEEV